MKTGREQRAEALLLDHLTPRQKRSYLERGCFETRGGRTYRRYRIYPCGAIARKRWFWPRRWLCYHVMDPLYSAGRLIYDSPYGQDWVFSIFPAADKMLALKCQVEFNERHILRYAGRYGQSPQRFHRRPLREPYRGGPLFKAWFTTVER